MERPIHEGLSRRPSSGHCLDGAELSVRLHISDTPDPTPTLPTQLQQLTTKVVAPARCADAGQSAGEICTDNPNRTDGPGGGDSGGPAVKYVRGVPQLVGGCSRAATQYAGVGPTVYTSSPYFRSWIYDTARGVPAAT
ncbi:trypsin-like serine protease [Kibdelosporangium philippinense]|uniref:Trypsin-like serine protease n=1 Tax=Kibdelosporangium philippinense TaxID=211113 RepID=A0ABS8ZIZ3_9PSEU|nr:trypsin-like serine protease [Kibdelosporangium philippinense]MCE7006925.1 trypsin-like serine protease [Kibdelosporangium philippinense]